MQLGEMMVVQLERAAAEIGDGRGAVVITTRELLSWFGAYRRGAAIVARIRAELEKHELITVPDFEGAWVDGPINIEPISIAKAEKKLKKGVIPPSDAAVLSSPDVADSWVNTDPTYRLSKLGAANNAPVCISPDSPLNQAITIMLARDFAQLPVMTNERDVRGVISWKTIGARLSQNNPGALVSDFMDTAQILSDQVSIFEAISIIVKYDYILVQRNDKKISGIVTASDLSIQFRLLSEPFLLLSEIENLLRNLVGSRINSDILRSTKDPLDVSREIDSVYDLTFGEYGRLLENQSNWTSLKINIDRVIFCKELSRVRDIRNSVMHFDPDGVTDESLGILQEFARFLKQLSALQAF